MDTKEENLPEKINHEDIPQPVRRSTGHAIPIHGLEPTMRRKMYENNNLIMNNVE